jgi:hypothetical protein
VSLGEVTLWVFGILVLIKIFLQLKNLVYKTLQPVVVPSLVFPLGVENANSIKETFKLSQLGPVLGPVALRQLYVSHGVVVLNLLIIIIGFSVVKGFHGELVHQGQISEPPLEEHDNGFVGNLWVNVPFASEMLVEFMKGFLFLLHNVQQVPLDS